MAPFEAVHVSTAALRQASAAATRGPVSSGRDSRAGATASNPRWERSPSVRRPGRLHCRPEDRRQSITISLGTAPSADAAYLVGAGLGTTPISNRPQDSFQGGAPDPKLRAASALLRWPNSRVEGASGKRLEARL